MTRLGSLSEEAEPLVQEALRPPRFWRPDDPRPVRRLGELGEPSALPALLLLLKGRSRSFTIEVATAIHRILSATPSGQLPSLDPRVRSKWPYELRSFDWSRVLGVVHPEVRRSLLGLATFHRSGYAREEALDLLEREGPGDELPYLLIRLNDWVPAVKGRAEAMVLERIHAANAERLVGALSIASRLAAQRRSDHSPVLDRIAEVLTESRCLPALAQGLQSADRAVSRYAASTLLLSQNPESRRYLSAIAHSPDPTVRYRLARWLPGDLPRTEASRWIDELKTDPYMTVRRECLEAIATQLSGLSPDTSALRPWLLDGHPAVRFLVRYYIDRSPGPRVDYASFYAAALGSSSSSIPAALSGLGEVGAEGLAVTVASFIGHPQAKVRHASVRAYGHLSKTPDLDRLLEVAVRDVPRVAREAAKILGSHVATLGPQRIEDALRSPTSTSSKKDLLRVLAAQMRWSYLASLLRLASDSSLMSLVAPEFQRCFRRFSSGFSPPSNVAELRQLAAVVSPDLPLPCQRELQFLLG